MSQTGYTPIQLYRSATPTNTPTSGNLADGELAINTADGKLFYKDSGGTVQTIATKAGANGDVVGPASATDGALTAFDGTTGKLVKNANLTANNVLLGNGTGAPLTVAPGANGNILTSNGTTWVSSAAPATGVTSFSAGTTGFTPSTGTTGAVTLAGTLGVANGGTGLTSTPTNGQLDIGNGTGFTRAVLTAGTGISITNGSGSITIATSGGASVNIGLTRAIAINCILP